MVGRRRREEAEFYNSRFPQRGVRARPRALNFLLENWYLFVAALASGSMLLWPMLSQAGGGAKVSPADAVQLINREKAVMIDISEPAEYAAGHAVGSKNVPLATLETSKDLPRNKTLPLLVVGSRAASAVPVLKKLGHENTRVLQGGLAAWRTANLPVEKTAVPT